MARRFPKAPSLKRRAATKQPQKKIIVVCEGKNTEPDYINAFARDKKHPLVSCKTIDGVGSPKTIVNKAIEEKKLLLRQAKKSKDSFDKNFEVWCLSDTDEHPNLFQEIQRAEDNGLFYALSNPCIELWGCLHYEQHDAPIHRHKIQRKLTGLMSDYDHDRGAMFNYDEMIDNYDVAKDRAKQLLSRREEEGTPKANPSTNIHELLDSIAKIDEPGQN